MLLWLSLCVCLFFFFVKQKTAYEMRISDWSADVCSSDLALPPSRPNGAAAGKAGADRQCSGRMPALSWARHCILRPFCNPRHGNRRDTNFEGYAGPCLAAGGRLRRERVRTEEHTYELQSLMRTSYAVFCLKKKNKK